MNNFVERFSTTNPISQLRRAQCLAADDEGEEFSDAAWGSEAGFGNLTKGLPTFTVPERISVSAARRYSSNLVYSYKGMGLSMVSDEISSIVFFLIY
jgi:hypothetical protein